MHAPKLNDCIKFQSVQLKKNREGILGFREFRKIQTIFLILNLWWLLGPKPNSHSDQKHLFYFRYYEAEPYWDQSRKPWSPKHLNP